MSINYFNIFVILLLFVTLAITSLLIIKTNNRYKNTEKQLKISYRELSNHFYVQSSLLKLTRSLITKSDKDELFNELLKITKNIFDPENISIMIKDNKGKLVVAAKYGSRQGLKIGEELKLGERFSGYAAERKKPLLINDGTFNFEEFGVKRNPALRSSMVVPLVTGGEMLGVINMARSLNNKMFTASDLAICETFANGIAIALKNYQLLSKIKENLLQTLNAFVASIDVKDNYTKNHSHNISNMTGLISYEYGLSERDTEKIMIAGLVHDIGKIGIPDSILNKRGPLDKNEYMEIKKHPVISAEIIGKIENLRSITPYILHHHERWDGKGYPLGLKGSKIPLGARIISIADTYDALVTDRPYRNALAKEEAIQEIYDNIKKQFDPELADIFLKIITYEPL